MLFRSGDPVTATFLGDAIIVGATLIGGGWAECCLGTLPVDDSSRSGSASLMLRPEQVTVVAGNVSDCGAQGNVLEQEFIGHSCILTVQVTDGTRLQVRCAVGTAPKVGAPVSLSVNGPAHVLR
mgnify:CR=1 FL=1